MGKKTTIIAGSEDTTARFWCDRDWPKRVKQIKLDDIYYVDGKHTNAYDTISGYRAEIYGDPGKQLLPPQDGSCLEMKILIQSVNLAPVDHL